MAFEWNWQPTPIELAPVDPRRKAAAASMEGYRTGNGMEGYIAIPMEQPAPGYSSLTTQVPQAAGQVLGGEGGMQRGIGDRNTANLYTPGSGANYALKEEYRANEARIAELEARLAEVNKQWAAGAPARARASLDDLDRQLAISRAKYGDISGAYGHLNRIDSRALANKDSGDDKKAKIASIVEQLENAYIMRNAEKEATAQAGWDNKIARLSQEYQELTGTPYAYAGASVDTGTIGAGMRPRNTMEFNSKMSGMKNMRKDGRLTEKQIGELFADASTLPNGAEKDAIMGELSKAMYDSVEVHDQKVAQYNAKVATAIDDFVNDRSKKFSKEAKQALKTEGGSAKVTRNGIDMEVKYIGVRDGKKTYEVWVDGKKKRTYSE